METQLDDPHPPTRLCNCPKCLASFDETALDPENVEAIAACLGDDAAMLRDAHPEAANNMDAAATLINRLYELQGTAQELSLGAFLPEAERGALQQLHHALAQRLYEKAMEGARGFENATAAHLSQLLRYCVDRGNPVDVAAYCAFLLFNQQRIEPRPQWVPWPQGDRWALAVDKAMVNAGLDCTTAESDPEACVALLVKHCQEIGRDIGGQAQEPVVPKFHDGGMVPKSRLAIEMEKQFAAPPLPGEQVYFDLLQRQPPKGWGVYRLPEDGPDWILVTTPDGEGHRVLKTTDGLLYELASAMLPPPAPEIEL